MIILIIKMLICRRKELTKNKAIWGLHPKWKESKAGLSAMIAIILEKENERGLSALKLIDLLLQFIEVQL